MRRPDWLLHFRWRHHGGNARPSALRANGRAGKLIAVGYELMDTTRAGLLDGTLTMVIAHPLQKLAQETISGMIRASKSPSEIGNQTTVLPFDIYTRENI
jgi:LacI family transcriptional regulator, galactose operon repressor